jgi:hypothetical protein
VTEFETTARAFEAARARASTAQHAEMQLLHVAVCDAREAGLSVRETAAALRVPKSTVARHWREGHRCPVPPPTWGSPEEYVAARRAIWAHAPGQFDGRVPYEWEDLPSGGRAVRAIALGAITLT